MKCIQILFVVLLPLLLLAMKCNSSKEDCIIEYDFTIPMSISPALDTFRVGDTLWLESVIPAELKDNNTGEMIDVSDFDFNISTALTIIDSINFLPAENHFEYLYIKGKLDIKFYSSTVITDIIYEPDILRKKHLKIVIICRKDGIFELDFHNLTENLKGVNLTNKNCIENLNLSYQMNDRSDNNFYLVGQSMIFNSESDFNLFGGYAFVVIE